MSRHAVAISLVSLVIVALAGSGVAGMIATELPETADPDSRYLFYLHGAWIEQHGVAQPHPHHGRYEYQEIVQALADRGFVVISERRTNPVHPVSYAQRVADQVRTLVARGVPPARITVAGHSKGGHMAMLVASQVQEPALRVVVMAGCGAPGAEFRRSYAPFLATRAASMAGWILSLYDAADREAGSCQEAFDRAPAVRSQERMFRTGKGHGLFYAPEPLWLDEVARWATE